MGKLGRAGAALAASALLAGAAALPAAAEAASGRLLESKDEGVALHFEESNESHQASLLHLDLHDGGVLKVYCVEFTEGATSQRDMVEVPWGSYPNARSPFHANRGKINWVLNHGYPAKSLEQLNGLEGVEWGQGGLEEIEAISATQAAIWHFSDGMNLKMSDPTDHANTDADHDIKALYTYLVDKAVDVAEPTAPAIKINPETVAGEAGELVGPFTVSTNGKITEIERDLPEGVELVDAEGKPVTAESITDGAELFLKVAADAAAGEGAFKLTTLSKVEIGRLFVVEGYDREPAQSLIVAQPSEVKAEGAAKGSWTVAPTTRPSETTTTTTAAPTTPSTPVPTTTTVAPAPVPGTDLPDTGANILVPILVGVGLLGAGAGALVWQRRRKTA